MASLNIASLVLHIDELRILISDKNFDVIAINETRLDSTISDKLVHIDGYTLIRKDGNRNGGGVCLYLRSSLNYQFRSDLKFDDNFEVLSVDILKPNCKPFNVTALYRPPNVVEGFFQNLENIVQILDLEGKECIFLGDLNCDYLKSGYDYNTTQLKQLSSIYQLTQLIKEPTRITSTTSTLIDVILTNEPSRVLASGVLHVSISDHNLIYAIRKFALPSRNTHQYVTARAFKNFNGDAFRDELKLVPWDTLNRFNTPDEMLESWQNMFLNVANRHAPIRSRRVRNKKAAWLTPELKKSISNRDKLKRQAIITKDPVIWDKFKKERNLINNRIKKAKADYYKLKFQNNGSNPREIWKTINCITHRKKTNNSSITELKNGDESLTEPSDICEMLNSHFSSIGSKLASALPHGNNSFEYYITPTESTFQLQHTTVAVVLKLIERLSPNKATGLDTISCRLLKEAAPIIASSLVSIINKSIDTGIFPLNWKIAKVFPLFKANDRTNPQNYRPISVLPVISKICERLVYDQLYSYLTEHDLLTKYQSGFRPLHSTVTALLNITNDWYLNIDNGLINMAVFIDLAKAFDTVSHTILLKKLELYGLRGRTLDWFSSYLFNRQQQCFVQGCLSKSQTISCGVPQGSILGPLLFLIYINDLPGCLQHTKPYMYADDTLLSASSASTAELQNNVSRDLLNIKDWLLSNKLSLNVTKTEYMFLGTEFKLSNLGIVLPVKIGNQEIPRVKNAKYLGVHLDENLKWNEHIDKLCSKVSRSISGLRQARDYVPLNILVLIYKALIQPVFDYCDVVWGNLNKELALRIQKLQNRVARIITFQSYDARSSEILKQLNWDDLATRRDKHLSLLMYDTINRRTPKYLSDLFSNSCENNPYKSCLRNQDFKVAIKHAPKTELYKGSFSYRGAMKWNSLPYEHRASKSKSNLKIKLSSE